MKYTLYHKNIAVLNSEFDLDSNVFRGDENIFSENHIPPGLIAFKNINHKPLSDALNLWWKSRIIPKKRLEDKLFKSTASLCRNSFGFNLSDKYWIKPVDSNMTWDKGNFLLNSFDEDFGKYITGHSQGLNIELLNTVTPDLFSNGEQNKRWIIEKRKRVLLKYGTLPYYQEPFNERLASEICNRLDFPFVPYSFKIKKNPDIEIYSACPCFINENTEYIPADFIQYVLKKDNTVSQYNHLINCCKSLNMKDIDTIKEQLSKMVLLDYITANEDRHFGNFGFIRDADSLEWKGLVSNFDTGNAMFYKNPTSDLRKSDSLMDNVKCKSFATNHKEQLKHFASNISKLNINFSKLKGIDLFYSNILSLNPKFDSERTELLCSLLNSRIENAKEIVFTQNDVTQNYFKEIIALDTSNKALPFKDKIGFAYKNVCGKNKIKQKIISDFLTNLNPISEQDLESKVKNYLRKIKNTAIKIDNGRKRKNNNKIKC